MTDLNSINIIGRVTHDIGEKDFSYLSTGTAKLSLSIAVNRSVKKNDKWEDEASFFEVVLFGKQAETIKQFINKGKQIAVEGSLKQDRWEKDGQKKSKVYILASSVQLLGGKSDNTNQGAAPAFIADDIKKPTLQALNEAGLTEQPFPEDIPF